MRKSLYFCLLVFVPFMIAAQPAKFVLTLKGIPDHGVQFEKLPMIGEAFQTETIRFGKRGTVTRNIQVKEPCFASLRYGKYIVPLWLVPGYSLQLTTGKGRPQVAGSAAPFTNYLLQKGENEKHLFRSLQNGGRDIAKSEEGYAAFLDTLAVHHLKFLAKGFAVPLDKVTRQFAEEEEISILYGNLYQKLMFGDSNVVRFRSYRDLYGGKASDTFRFTEKASFGDKRLLKNFVYHQFVAQFIADIALKKVKEAWGAFSFSHYIDTGMQVAKRLTNNGATTTAISAIFLNQVLEQMERESKTIWAPKMDSVFRELSAAGEEEPPYLQLMAQRLHKVVTDSRFVKGAPAPNFTFRDGAGKTYQLKDFAGKWVYIDIGASWCGPCSKGIPAWNRLVRQNGDNPNIVFISLSLDDKEADWKKWTARYRPLGLVLFAGGEFQGTFAKAYNVRSLPRFILLDKEGRIENVDAPGPESSALPNVLREMAAPSK